MIFCLLDWMRMPSATFEIEKLRVLVSVHIKGGGGNFSLRAALAVGKDESLKLREYSFGIPKAKVGVVACSKVLESHCNEVESVLDGVGEVRSCNP